VPRLCAKMKHNPVRTRSLGVGYWLLEKVPGIFDRVRLSSTIPLEHRQVLASDPDQTPMQGSSSVKFALCTRSRPRYCFMISC
jgi:hypothetical protein